MVKRKLSGTEKGESKERTRMKDCPLTKKNN